MNLRHALLLMLAVPVAAVGGLRDPTRPPMPQAPASAVVRESLPSVSALFISASSRKALVNGRLVQVGDSVDDGKIEAVSADGVIWRRRGTAHELLLPRSLANFKKPAAGPARVDNGVP